MAAPQARRAASPPPRPRALDAPGRLHRGWGPSPAPAPRRRGRPAHAGGWGRGGHAVSIGLATDDLTSVVGAIREARRITAICHESPVGDTLGAALAIAIIAERLGKQAEVVAGDPIPPFLAFLPRVDRVRSEPRMEPDVAVIVDAGDLARTGTIAREHADWLKRA